MKQLLKELLVVAGLGLAGCAGVAKPSPDQVESAACHALPLADLTFRLFAPMLKIAPDQMSWETGVNSAAVAACKTQGQGWEKVVEASLMAISDFLAANGVQAARPGG